MCLDTVSVTVTLAVAAVHFFEITPPIQTLLRDTIMKFNRNRVAWFQLPARSWVSFSSFLFCFAPVSAALAVCPFPCAVRWRFGLWTQCSPESSGAVNSSGAQLVHRRVLHVRAVHLFTPLLVWRGQGFWGVFFGCLVLEFLLLSCFVLVFGWLVVFAMCQVFGPLNRSAVF